MLNSVTANTPAPLFGTQQTGAASTAPPTGRQNGGATGLPGLPGIPSGMSQGAGTQTGGATLNGLSGSTQTGGATLNGLSGSSSMSGSSSSSSGSGSGGSTSGSSSTNDTSGTNTFLQLLVAQLRNQDPTQPMDGSAFITELAQFNTVEQLINLKQSVDSEVLAQQSNEAFATIGKTVTYTVPGVGNNGSTSAQGLVSGVDLQGGQVQLQINGQNVPLSQVTAVAP